MGKCLKALCWIRDCFLKGWGLFKVSKVGELL